MADTPIRRCAVYTRKSSEEGLEQDFNSLHAQREACEAFIKSQAGEGWRLIKTAYDDGGLSGDTMERPALQHLLANIREGLIDVVVVYKVIVSAVKASNNGNHRGGKPFSRGGLYHLLSNPVFVGEIRHKQERHPGQHQEIVNRELWKESSSDCAKGRFAPVKATRPRRRVVRSRVSSSMKTASLYSSRGRLRADAAIATTSEKISPCRCARRCRARVATIRA